MGTGSGKGLNFGTTIGSQARNRIGVVVEETIKSLDMALNPTYYANVIASKYGINLKGSGYTISVIFNPKLSIGIFGRTSATNPYVIEIGSAALMNERELANTIAHELNHARSFIEGGNAPERNAYKSGHALDEYIRGLR